MKTKLKPIFIPGSPWLYLKIYCGEVIANELLKNQLYKILLKSKNPWFFIRYHDPDFHLRIRIKVIDHEIDTFQKRVYQSLEPLIQQRVIWKLQYDTYQREIERYSEEMMEFSEELFCIQSKFLLQTNTFFSRNPSEKFFKAFNLVDVLVSIFIKENESKLKFYHANYELFSQEFLVDKNFTKQLNNHYKENFSKVKELSLSYDKENYTFENQIKKTIKKYKVSPNDVSSSIISSHVHMLVNRFFTNDQRKYELIIYHHLFKFYSTMKWNKLE